jgi:ATP-dependent protease ClpP protease subunit
MPVMETRASRRLPAPYGVSYRIKFEPLSFFIISIRMQMPAAKSSLPGPDESVDDEPSGPAEIAIVGDLTDNATDLIDKLLGVEPGSECTIYFDSPGGNPYTANSLVAVMRLRGLRTTGIVTGECSSAAVWPFAACDRRLVTASSVLLFHPMKWQSEEQIGIREAAEWSRHFTALEEEMDQLLVDLFGCKKEASAELVRDWCREHRYVTGRELAAAGLAELIELAPLPELVAATDNQPPQ